MRIYFASDVHGSNRCWLKFLAAGRFYEADVIVMADDITGKAAFFEIDDLLDASARIEHPEGRSIELEGLELIGVGFANITPWQCPRDISEAELRARIDEAAAQVKDMERALFSIHVPPFDTE